MAHHLHSIDDWTRESLDNRSESKIRRRQPRQAEHRPDWDDLLEDELVALDFSPTYHGRLRMNQRNLSVDDIRFVLAYGEEFHCAGAVIVHLRGKDIPRWRQHDRRYARLEGTTVVLGRDREVVITAYRNREGGLHEIKCKRRYGRPQ